MSTLIINSGCANIASVKFALERLGETTLVSDKPNEILSADRVILPGVGTINFAMDELHSKNIVESIKSLACPVLGICLGMQLLFEGSSEGSTPSLGLIKGSALEFPKNNNLSVPHMGWNNLDIIKNDPLLMGVNNGDYVYFVHSFYLPVQKSTIARANYGTPFSAVIRQDNIWGCQFHPERSSAVGAKILENFIGLPC